MEHDHEEKYGISRWPSAREVSVGKPNDDELGFHSHDYLCCLGNNRSSYQRKRRHLVAS